MIKNNAVMIRNPDDQPYHLALIAADTPQLSRRVWECRGFRAGGRWRAWREEYERKAGSSS